jgi:hypothetical protein
VGRLSMKEILYLAKEMKIPGARWQPTTTLISEVSKILRELCPLSHQRRHSSRIEILKHKPAKLPYLRRQCPAICDEISHGVSAIYRIFHSVLRLLEWCIARPGPELSGYCVSNRVVEYRGNRELTVTT